jgi:para-aminobenzoate synthetase component 1
MPEPNFTTFSFQQEELQTLKDKMLNWLSPFSIFAYLDNNNYKQAPCRFELLIGAGALHTFDSPEGQEGNWLFGHFAYDYKNVIEPRLHSSNSEKTGFQDSFFFSPEVVLCIPAGTCELQIYAAHESPEAIWQQLLQAGTEMPRMELAGGLPWKTEFTRDAYMDTVEAIRRHIKEGDCYELNFCTASYVTQTKIDPVAAFCRLNKLNPAPFAALYRNNDAWLICASPERFLFRDGIEVYSQPIKGTAGRSKDIAEDEQLKKALLLNEKERAENVMITDLVRNDLAKSSLPGSISVPELFGLYTYPTVHQLISTVKGTLKENIANNEIIRNAFPMGSMTGAPKVMVMELIERYERSRRGIYSGTVGYIMPGGDFDFNVVIRSLLYNAEHHYLSYQTGGAITYDSVAAQEWEEVRLKAKAMQQVFL